jgi:small subunit ribosomal protein S2
MAEVGVTDLLQAGVHFGHQTARWNPRMRRYIFGEREGIHIIDLLQTDDLLKQATEFVTEIAGKGGVILFVGTKKQATDSIAEWAERCGMPYVNRRWLGGLLTNFSTIKQRIKRLHELRDLRKDGRLELLPTKERMSMERELEKLEFNLGGVADMQRLPDAVVIVDLKTEEIALRESSRLEIPIIGLVDTNCDPRPLDFAVPGNDDAIRSCSIVIGTLGQSIEGAAGKWREEEARRKAEEEEKRRKEDEERKKREAEDKAKAEAEAKATAEAEAKLRAEAEAKAKAVDAESQAKAEAEAKAKAKAEAESRAKAEAAAKAEAEASRGPEATTGSAATSKPEESAVEPEAKADPEKPAEEPEAQAQAEPEKPAEEPAVTDPAPDAEAKPVAEKDAG